MGAPPIKTLFGWLHQAHGVRNTAAGLRYVLYSFLTDLKDLTKVTHKPAGYLLAPENEERTGDVSNVVFSNGWIVDKDGKVFIYYASSDTRLHVATSTVDQLVDYVMNTAADRMRSSASVDTLKGSSIETESAKAEKIKFEISLIVKCETLKKIKCHRSNLIYTFND